MTDMDWFTDFLMKVANDPDYVTRLRQDPVSAIREVPNVPQELEDELQQGMVVQLPPNDDRHDAIKLWLDQWMSVMKLSRFHFLLK